MTNNWMQRRWVLGLAVFAVTAASYAQWSNPADDVPAYHPSAPLKVSALPPILSGKQLTGEHFRYPWQVHVYQQAAKIGSVLYQLALQLPLRPRPGPHQPAQLLMRDAHGTECSTCAKEGFLRLPQTKLGKTPAEIRAGHRPPRVREDRSGEAVAVPARLSMPARPAIDSAVDAHPVLEDTAPRIPPPSAATFGPGSP